MTIFAISVAISVMEITASMSFVISSTIWAFQATVEQSMFVGLLGCECLIISAPVAHHRSLEMAETNGDADPQVFGDPGPRGQSEPDPAFDASGV